MTTLSANEPFLEYPPDDADAPSVLSPPSAEPPPWLKPGRPFTSTTFMESIFCIGLTHSLIIPSIFSANFCLKALLRLASLLAFSASLRAFLPAASISYLIFAAIEANFSRSAFLLASITPKAFAFSACSTSRIVFTFSSASTALALAFSSSIFVFNTDFDFSRTSSCFCFSSISILLAFSMSKTLVSCSAEILNASTFFC